MKKVWFTLGGLALTFAVCATEGCSSGFSCDQASPCPKDTVSQTDRASCKTEQAGKCSAQFNAQASCILGQYKCKADGTLDSAATTAAYGVNCAQQLADYQKCKTANPG